MASFQAKTGWDSLRVIQKTKKVIVPIHSNPIRNKEFPKNSKKMQTFKKHHCGFILNQNGTVKAKNDIKKKKKLSLRSFRTRPIIGNSKKVAKICEKLKNIFMASFQANIGWKRLRKREQKLSLRFVLTRQVIENSKKIAKKFKNLKNTFMASFQANIGWKRLRKRENKNYRCFSSLPDA